MKRIFAIASLCLSLTAFADPHISIKVHALTGADARDEDRIDRALELIEGAVNSEEFKTQLLNQKFTQTTATSAQVLARIIEGVENFAGGEKHQIDLFLDMYYKRNSTVGYTSPKDKFIHMNRYFHANYSAEQAAGNIFHEWLHKIGFDHSQRNNADRPHSVPYKLGKLIIECAQ